MLFLTVLTLATAGAAVTDRHDARATARRGMGVALAVAGVAHLVMPTPFEQHLPDWVPAATLLVWVTGAIEIAIGLALLGTPGRPRSGARRAVGRLAAAYLVAVLPANVYVAVAGVDVDGQPGGAYPWLRLPFQALFIAWVLWSTGEPRPTPTADDGDDLPHLRLPWAHGPAGRRLATVGGGDRSRVVMASRLELRNMRDVPAFLIASLRLRGLFQRSPGAIALSLRAAPAHRTFWTLSMWEDRSALHDYAGHPRHVAVMERFGPAMAASTFADWPTSLPGLPSWPDAHRRVTTSVAPHRPRPGHGQRLERQP